MHSKSLMAALRPGGCRSSRKRGHLGSYEGAREVGGSSRLVALLRGLGVGSDVVEASIRRNDAIVARAAELIAEWTTYLPEDCVKAMVSDGWHWST
jgi:hypothetical protein